MRPAARTTIERAGLHTNVRRSKSNARMLLEVCRCADLRPVRVHACSGSCSGPRQRSSRINVLYEAEMIHRRVPWKTAVELATLEWLVWFDHHRSNKPLSYILPPRSRTTTVDNAVVRP